MAPFIGSLSQAPRASDLDVNPFALELPMAFNSDSGMYEVTIPTAINLSGRRLTISTDAGGADNIDIP